MEAISNPHAVTRFIRYHSKDKERRHEGRLDRKGMSHEEWDKYRRAKAEARRAGRKDMMAQVYYCAKHKPVREYITF